MADLAARDVPAPVPWIAAARDAPGRWVEGVGRVGLAAYGAVHLMLAWLALRVGVLGARAQLDQRGAVATIASGGVLGRVLLLGAAVALAAFAVWQVRAAAVGYRWVVEEGLRRRKRLGALAKAGGVLSVAWVSARFVVRHPGDRRGFRTICTELFALPGGRLVVAALALVILGMSVAMAVTGARRTFFGDLAPERLPHRLRRPTLWLGAVGNLTRAGTFGSVGVLLLVAAAANAPDDIADVDGALRTVAAHSLGAVVILAAAAGFAAFGLYCVVDAWARHP